VESEGPARYRVRHRAESDDDDDDDNDNEKNFDVLFSATRGARESTSDKDTVTSGRAT
jgi:hypothetical protein